MSMPTAPVLLKQARAAAKAWEALPAAPPASKRVPIKTGILKNPTEPLTLADTPCVLNQTPLPDENGAALEIITRALPNGSPAEKRTLALKGLLGGCSTYSLRAHAGCGASMVQGAKDALTRCKIEKRMEPALWFASRSGKGGKKRKYGD